MYMRLNSARIAKGMFHCTPSGVDPFNHLGPPSCKNEELQVVRGIDA